MISSAREEAIKKRQEYLEGVWDLVWRDDVKTLIVYSINAKPDFILGEDEAHKFLSELNKYKENHKSPYDRINPLEMKDENGLYCHKTARYNARKTMNVQELAIDERYHDYGHLFLSEMVLAQHTATKGVYDTHKALSAAIEKLGELGGTGFMNETNVADLQSIKGVLEDIGTAKKLLAKIDEKLLSVLNRWVP